jgi:calcineurin-like phosphoesterase family protein
MSDVWLTADFHLGHQNIIRYCSRPFESVAVMDAEILDRLNSSVREGDSLYFLGDFCRGSGKEALDYRKRIRCKNIFFIEGNHDASTRKIAYRIPVVEATRRSEGRRPNDRPVPLCHACLASFVPRSLALVWAFAWPPTR